MPLQKQQIAVNFQKGLDTKSDPWQVPLGNFLELENSVFTKQGLLQKRNGFDQIGYINDQTTTNITTFNNELTLVGSNIYSYKQPLEGFLNQGPFFSVEFNKLNLLADSYDQKQVDSVTSPNGLVCVVYYSADRASNNWKFAILDNTSGQTVITIQNLTPNAGAIYSQGYGKVFYFKGKFVIIFPVTILGVTELQLISIDSVTLTVSPAITVSGTYNPTNAGTTKSKNWDAAVSSDNIMVGYNSGINTFYVNTIYSNLSVGLPTQIDPTIAATTVGATSDGTDFYFAYYDNNTGNGKVVGISLLNGIDLTAVVSGTSYKITDVGTTTPVQWHALGVPLAIVPAVGVNFTASVSGAIPGTGKVQNFVGNPVATFVPQLWVATPGITILNIGLVVQSSTINIVYEVQAPAYTYFPSSYPISSQYSNQIAIQTCSTAGVVGPAPTSPLLKGAGLASRPFLFAGDFYFAICYSRGNNSTTKPVETNQACYFLVNSSGKILTQFAYGNGNGYSQYNIPNVSVQQFTGNSIQNSNTITGIPDTSNLKVGQKIVSANFPTNNNFITAIDSISQITVSRPANVTGTTICYSNVVEFAYLYANIIQPLGLPTPTSTTAAHINTFASALAQIELYKEHVEMTELGKNLNISSGFLWGYDGCEITENNFFVYPDSIYVAPNLNTSGSMVPDTYYYRITYEWTDNQGNLFRSVPSVPFEYKVFAGSSTVTGDTTSGSNVIKNVSSTKNLTAGQIISGAGIPSKTLVTSIDSSTQMTISNSATATATGVTLSLNFVTGDTSIGLTTITNISNTSQLQFGQKISGAGIPVGAYILSVDSSSQITISAPATANGAAVTLTILQNTCASINVPTLRLSYKSDVNIVVYRYSTLAPAYYQLGVTGFNTVLVTKNDPTVDYLTILDKRAIFNDYPNFIIGVVGNPLLYTTGGIVENTRTPPCKASTIFDGRLWIIDSENSTLWYSKQVLQATPVEFSDLFTYFISPGQNFQGNAGKPTTLSVLDDKLIIFKQNSIFYINGNGPDNTGTNSQYSEPILITSTVGCANPNSIAIVPQGIICQSNKGIWLLGRDLSTSYIGAPVEEFTNNSTVVSAQTIPGTNQVRFALSSGIMVVYDYYYNQWSTFTGIPQLDSTIYNGFHTFIDNYGRIAQEKPGTYLDITNPVLMKFKTCWYALGGIQGFQRAYFLFLLGKYYSPHKLNVELAYDFDPGFTQATLITPNNYASIYGSDPVYGASDVWGGASQVEKWRIMLTKQKCDSVQIKVSEVYDSSFGVEAGAGLSLSGMNFIIGVKKGYGPISQFNTAG